jgi:multidrug resistance efflux pump
MKKNVSKHPRVMISHLKIRMSFFIWLLALVAAIFVYFHGGRFGGMTGSVHTTFDNPAPLEAGRLNSIRVRVGDRVTKGTPLAQMDSSLLEAEKEVLQAEAGALQGELDAVSTEVARLEKLMTQQLVDEQDILSLRIKQRTLQAAKASSEIEKKICLLDMRIQNCTLRAQADGVVSRIYHSPGDVVQAGDPVLSSVIHQAPVVVGFLSEYNARDVSVGMQTYLTPVSRRGVVIRAKIVSFTPEVFALPGRVNPVPSKSYRGRRVLIEPEEHCTLLPGEEVQIHFRRPWTLSLLGELFKSEATQ